MEGKPNFLNFLSREYQNFLTSFVTLHEEFGAFSTLDGFYDLPLGIKEVPENWLIAHQMLWFSHYLLFFSVACFMRAHLSDAHHALRTAIDAAMIGHTVIGDPSLQADYIERRQPFDNLKRHINNRVINGTETSLQIKHLIKRHGECSRFASHADLDVFVHRLDLKALDMRKLSLGYFQIASTPQEISNQFNLLVRDFGCVLDVFSEHLVGQLGLPKKWQSDLREFLGSIEKKMELSFATGNERR